MNWGRRTSRLLMSLLCGARVALQMFTRLVMHIAQHVCMYDPQLAICDIPAKRSHNATHESHKTCTEALQHGPVGGIAYRLCTPLASRTGDERRGRDRTPLMSLMSGARVACRIFTRLARTLHWHVCMCDPQLAVCDFPAWR